MSSGELGLRHRLAAESSFGDRSCEGRASEASGKYGFWSVYSEGRVFGWGCLKSGGVDVEAGAVSAVRAGVLSGLSTVDRPLGASGADSRC